MSLIKNVRDWLNDEFQKLRFLLALAACIVRDTDRRQALYAGISNKCKQLDRTYK
jgi:hypothetical protein